MARSLKTSIDIEKKVQHLITKLNLSNKNDVLKLALSISIRNNEDVLQKYSLELRDNSGNEYHRTTIFNKNDEWIYYSIIRLLNNEYISEDKIFPDMIKAHIINGVTILYKLDTENSSQNFDLKKQLIELL